MTYALSVFVGILIGIGVMRFVDWRMHRHLYAAFAEHQRKTNGEKTDE